MAASRLEQHIREALDGFSGNLPLFPLPNVVLFPMAVLPLHIFEPRYLAMIEHVLAGEKLMGMAFLLEGWQKDYEGRPPVHEIVCLGRILQAQTQPDGTYNILLEGIIRTVILSEDHSHPFRIATVHPAQEFQIPKGGEGLWRQRLDMLIARTDAEVSGPIRKMVGTLTGSQLPLGPVLDLLAHALPLEPKDKHEILAELTIENRARLVLEHLSRWAATPPAPQRRPD
jgi:Lon protease-like protein